jgi:myo-inositol-1(or 4)-monophosphatase
MGMTSEALSDLQSQVNGIVTASASYLEQHWQLHKQVGYKERSDPVTEFDVHIENELRGKLSELLPEAGFIVEEGETIETDGYNWVIDPIDQTKNFVGQIPLFYTQVALIEDGIPVLGVIYNPVSHQLFSASRGNGTKLNGQKLPSSTKQKLEEAIVDVDFGDDSDLAWKLQTLKTLTRSAFRLRISGGSYAAYLLTGGVDVYIVINQKTKPVDQLPRIILAREAGLLFDEYLVGDRTILLAGPPNIANEVLDIIRQQV